MIKISTDSTADLPKHLVDEFGISVFPLIVTLGDNEYFDGVNISPDDIYKFVDESKILPKTSARSIEDFKEYFSSLLTSCDAIVHCGIGSKLSVCYSNACRAVEELGLGDKVKIVDSCALSSGTGLTVLSGAVAARAGKSLDEVVSEMTKSAQNTQTSFTLDKLEYLYKGGRCSRFTFSVAGLLKIKPRLEIVDGSLINTGKEIGPLKSVLIKYVDSILKKHPSPRKDFCFITHTAMSQELVDMVVEYVKSKNIFEHVEENLAGSVITSHCGKNTLGILYINDVN